MASFSTLITSAGGPAAENVVRNFRLANKGLHIVGTDIDRYMINLSTADTKYVIKRATDTENYIKDINRIAKIENVSMLYPQSDIEVSICSANRDRLPRMTLPEHRVIEICQDKAKLYEYLADRYIQVPKFALYPQEKFGIFTQDEFPLWARATKGAGGNKSFLCRNWDDMIHMESFWKGREDIQWMLSQYLDGNDYSWTSIWKDGRIVAFVLKQRLEWVYNKIGTCAVQKTIIHPRMERYCEEIVKALDPNLTGIMMIDLKQDSKSGEFYITECNAGRLGTVNLWFGIASKHLYKNTSVNFPYLLWLIHHKLWTPDFDNPATLPADIFCIRHLDMGIQVIFPCGKIVKA